MNKAHLQYHWWKYLLVFIFSFSVWYTVFHSIAQPNPNEKLNVLFVGESLDAQGLETEIKQHLPDLTSQELQQVKVTQTYLQGDEMFQVLQTRFYEYDIVIISESCLQKNMGVLLEQRFMTQALCRYFSEYMLYVETSENGAAAYGFLMEQSRGLFANYYLGKEKCYCFPSPWSENFGGLNSRGEKADDCALVIMDLLLNGYVQEVSEQ